MGADKKVVKFGLAPDRSPTGQVRDALVKLVPELRAEIMAMPDHVVWAVNNRAEEEFQGLEEQMQSCDDDYRDAVRMVAEKHGSPRTMCVAAGFLADIAEMIAADYKPDAPETKRVFDSMLAQMYVEEVAAIIRAEVGGDGRD